MQQLTTITEMLRHIRQHYSNPTALNYLKDGKWERHSTEQMMLEIRQFALGLIVMGVKRGDMVGLLAHPSSQWTIIDLAIMVAGGVNVPLFANISNENFVFEVTQTNTRLLIVSGREQWEMYERHQELFDQVIAFNGECPGCLTYQDVLEKGKELDKEHPELYEELENQLKPDDLATIIYTSGSTGVPKGAELTQQNLVALIHLQDLMWDPHNDVYLNILPLAHVFGRVLNYFILGWGISIYYPYDIKNIAAICREIHPTILVVVPRVLEKVYSKMLSGVEHAGFMKRKLGQWAFELAGSFDESLYKHLMHPIADTIVYHALRDALGGKIRIVISGGAALNPFLAHFFIEIGVPIYEGWGLTEASTVCVNTLRERKVGTVGRPLGDMKVKISPEGEILVKGPIVLRGYYKNPEATAATLDAEGWLHTGDKGIVDADGYVTIQGRLKEMYKTSTGEYIVPVPIEQAFCKTPLIDMALVIGQDRKFASVLLVPDFDILHSMKSAHQLRNLSDEEFLKTYFVKTEMKRLIDTINEHLNNWEKIRSYRFILHPLSIESGELTPSMKIRRDVVTKKYQHLIDEMYQEEVQL